MPPARPRPGLSRSCPRCLTARLPRSSPGRVAASLPRGRRSSLPRRSGRRASFRSPRSCVPRMAQHEGRPLHRREALEQTGDPLVDLRSGERALGRRIDCGGFERARFEWPFLHLAQRGGAASPPRSWLRSCEATWRTPTGPRSAAGSGRLSRMSPEPSLPRPPRFPSSGTPAGTHCGCASRPEPGRLPDQPLSPARQRLHRFLPFLFFRRWKMGEVRQKGSVTKLTQPVSTRRTPAPESSTWSV